MCDVNAFGRTAMVRVVIIAGIMHSDPYAVNGM